MLTTTRGALAIVAAAGSGGAVASAAPQSWVGAVSGDWNDPTRWSGGAVPDGAGMDATIDAVGAAYTVNLNINALVDRFVLNSVDATLLSNGRTLSVNLSADLDAGLARFTGGGIAGAGALTNRARFEAISSVTISTASFVNEGMLDIVANGSFNSVLNRSGDMTNSGTVRLTSTAPTSAGLSVTGTLANAVGGSIEVEAASGGARALTAATLENDGTVTLGASTALNGTNGSYTNRGLFTVAAGRTATLSGSGTLSFNQDGGTLDNQGAFEVNAEVFNFNGGTITGNAVTMNGGALNIAGSGAGAFDLISTVGYSGDIADGQRVRVLATGSFNSQLSGSSFTNAGRLVLDSSAGTAATLSMSGTLTNGASGVVEVLAGAGGGRSLTTGGLVNDGSVVIGADTSLNGGNGVYTNNASFIVQAGRTATLAGAGTLSFNQNAGVLDNQGGFASNGEIFNFNGGTIAGNAVAINGGTLNNLGSGSAAFDLFQTVNYSGNISGAQTVRLVATGGFNGQINAGGFSNSGVLALTSTAGTSATLNASGTVVNEVGGLIDVRQGSGGTRSLTTVGLVNNGTARLDHNTALNGGNGVYTNNATFRIEANRTATLQGAGTLTFNQDGGVLENLGQFVSNGEVFNFNGGTIAGNAVVINGGSLNNPAAGSAAFDLFQTVTYSGNISSDQVVRLIATGGFNAQLNASSFVNSGLFQMTSTAGTSATLSMGGTYTNGAGGVFDVLAGAGGTRSLTTTNFVNNGAMNVRADVALNGGNGQYANNADWLIEAGRTLTLQGSGTLGFDQNDGVLNNLGTFVSSGEVFNLNGGSIAGNAVNINGGSLNINAAGAAEFDLAQTVVYAGDISNAQRVRVIANSGFNAVMSASSFTNSGELILTSTAGTSATLESGGTITNGAAGLLEVREGNGGARVLSVSSLVNNGRVLLDANTTINQGNGVVTNNASFEVAAGRSVVVSGSGVLNFNQDAGLLDNQGAFRLDGEAFNFNGGVIAGNAVRLNGGSLNISATTAGAFDLNGTVAFGGNIAGPQIVRVEANSFANALMTAGSFANDGTLALTSVAGTTASLAASTFTNRGLFAVEAGAGGARSIDANIVNEGTADFGVSTSLVRGNGTQVNRGLWRIAGGAELIVGGSGVVTFVNEAAGIITGGGRLDNLGVDVFQNDGTFAPGDGVGTLEYEGDWSQSATGVLDIELAGRNAGEFDLLRVFGDVGLDGTLRVSVNGFIPSAVDAFVVLDGDSLTGVFANAAATVQVVGGGSFDVLYDAAAGTVTLTNYVPAPGVAGVLVAAGVFAGRRRR